MTDTESQLDIIEKGPLPDEAAAEPQEEVAADTPTEEPEEAADGADEDSQEEPEEEKEEEPKPKRRRNRTAKIAAKLTNAERQIAELQGQLQQLQPPAKEPPPPPKQDDYASYEEYVRADAEYVARGAARQEMQGLTQQVEKATKEVQTRQRWAEFYKRESKASEKYDDYQEVARADDLPVTEEMTDILLEMEEGPEVLYHLGLRPEESSRIAQLSPRSQAIELGRIAAKLSRPKPKSTNAPNPVKTVKGGSAPQGVTLATAPTMADYARLRQEQIDKERKGTG